MVAPPTNRSSCHPGDCPVGFVGMTPFSLAFSRVIHSHRLVETLFTSNRARLSGRSVVRYRGRSLVENFVSDDRDLRRGVNADANDAPFDGDHVDRQVEAGEDDLFMTTARKDQREWTPFRIG